VEGKFSIRNYSQIFYGIGLEYRGLADLIIKGHYISVPGEGYNTSFTDVEFRTLSSAPTMYRLDVRLMSDDVSPQRM
jgi:hypothetical protein